VNPSLLLMLMVTVLCVEGWTHEKTDFLTDTQRGEFARGALEDELGSWRSLATGENELRHSSESSEDDSEDSSESDDSDEHHEAEDEEEEEEEEGNEGSESHFRKMFFLC